MKDCKDVKKMAESMGWVVGGGGGSRKRKDYETIQWLKCKCFFHQ